MGAPTGRSSKLKARRLRRIARRDARRGGRAGGTWQQLADALEKNGALAAVSRRGRASRDDGGVWAVAGRRIEVARLHAGEGEVLDLAMVGGESSARTSTASRRSAACPSSSGLAGREGTDYAVHAERIDGDLWDIRIAPL